MWFWGLAENRRANGGGESARRAGILLGAALALVAPACGSSASNKNDAASNRDGADVPTADLPLGPEVEPPRDAPLGLETPGEANPPEAKAPEANAPEAKAPEVNSPEASAPEANGPADTGVEAGPSFCAAAAGVDAGAIQRLCYDFTDPASAGDFVPEAGTWTVADGTYTAMGPPKQVTCPNGDGSLMTESVLANVTAQDVRVHAKMTAIKAPDKVIVLRSRPGGNRIELNFRANFVFDGIAQGGDLYVSALIDCTNVEYVPVGTILIPHAIGQAIVADVQLIGRRLTVAVDGKTVFDETLPRPSEAGAVSFPTQAGKVGFAAFLDAVTQYDDLLIEVLK